MLRLQNAHTHCSPPLGHLFDWRLFISTIEASEATKNVSCHCSFISSNNKKINNEVEVMNATKNTFVLRERER